MNHSAHRRSCGHPPRLLNVVRLKGSKVTRHAVRRHPQYNCRVGCPAVVRHLPPARKASATRMRPASLALAHLVSANVHVGVWESGSDFTQKSTDSVVGGSLGWINGAKGAVRESIRVARGQEPRKTETPAQRVACTRNERRSNRPADADLPKSSLSPGESNSGMTRTPRSFA